MFSTETACTFLSILTPFFLREERKWRKWVDSTFVHTLSPNIYRTASEAMQAFEYFTKCSNFSAFDRYTTYMAGPLVMYFIGKHVKHK